MAQSTALARRRQGPSLRLMTAEEMLSRMRETFDAVARRAFEIFEANGRRLGHHLEDWFQAEAELLHPVHLRISDTDGTLTIRAEVPGFSEKDLQVRVEPRRLTISGKRESAEEQKKGKTIYTERCSNQIFRAVSLPAEVDVASSAIKATCAQGVLRITLPKLERAKAREIKVEPKPAQE